MVTNLNETFAAVQAASRELAILDDTIINQILNAVADAAIAETPFILAENEKDLARMDKNDPKYDRLKLTEERLKDIATDTRNVATLPSPLGRVLKETIRPNGMKLTKISVPFGAIGIIYEARPNVSFDVFSLCLKSGNACVLKGGSDADYSNRAIICVIHEVLKEFNINPHIVELLPVDREATTALLNAVGYIDLVIPRGSSNLINFVRNNAKIPVIETGTGNCHIFVDETADFDMAMDIILNAKTQRIGVCNACESLVIHEKIADTFLPELMKRLAEKNVEVHGDEKVMQIAGEGCMKRELLVPATEEDWGREYLDYKLSAKTVSSIDEAIAHINQYNTGHSEAIITNNYSNAEKFLNEIDAACVYVNASTRFTDGFEFGFGAEIGISTQKLHARGPMGLIALTSTKYIIYGNGQIRK